MRRGRWGDSTSGDGGDEQSQRRVAVELVERLLARGVPKHRRRTIGTSSNRERGGGSSGDDDDVEEEEEQQTERGIEGRGEPEEEGWMAGKKADGPSAFA